MSVDGDVVGVHFTPRRREAGLPARFITRGEAAVLVRENLATWTTHSERTIHMRKDVLLPARVDAVLLRPRTPLSLQMGPAVMERIADGEVFSKRIADTWVRGWSQLNSNSRQATCGEEREDVNKQHSPAA